LDSNAGRKLKVREIGKKKGLFVKPFRKVMVLEKKDDIEVRVFNHSFSRQHNGLTFYTPCAGKSQITRIDIYSRTKIQTIKRTDSKLFSHLFHTGYRKIV